MFGVCKTKSVLFGPKRKGVDTDGVIYGYRRSKSKIPVYGGDVVCLYFGENIRHCAGRGKRNALSPYDPKYYINTEEVIDTVKWTLLYNLYIFYYRDRLDDNNNGWWGGGGMEIAATGRILAFRGCTYVHDDGL